MQRLSLLLLVYGNLDSTRSFLVQSSSRSHNGLIGDQGHVNGFPHRTLARFPVKFSTIAGHPPPRFKLAMSSNAVWPPDDRLGEYITESGLVDYTKLAKEEKDWLSGAISGIQQTDPRTLEASDRHAFLINAYNLWTLYWVLRERRWPWWKGHVNALAKARFFYWNTISTGQGRRNLYNFENKDIRPDVDDARIHFALNCASISCPALRRKLYMGSKLDAELDEVTSETINGGAFVQVKEDGNLVVNPIFKWYREDFDKEGGMFAFIKKHWRGAPLAEGATIDFFEYDWRSNSADAAWSDRPLGGPAP